MFLYWAVASGVSRSQTIQLLLHGLCNAPATLPDAATDASWPLERSYDAPVCCHCCFLASVTLLQRSRTLTHAAPQRAWPLQLPLLQAQHAPATLQDDATLLLLEAAI